MTAGDDWPPIADPVARIVVLFRGGTTIRALTDMFGLPDQVVEGIIRMAARLAQAEQRIIELEDGVEDRAREERERIARAIEAKHGDPCAWTTKVAGSGPDRHVERVYHCTCVEAARIARGGGVQ